MKNLYLCTYFYENNMSGANTMSKVCDSIIACKYWVTEQLYNKISNLEDGEISTIQDLINDKPDAETEIATLDDDAILEYDAGGFRLTVDHETHTARRDLIVEGLEVELS